MIIQFQSIISFIIRRNTIASKHLNITITDFMFPKSCLDFDFASNRNELHL